MKQKSNTQPIKRYLLLAACVLLSVAAPVQGADGTWTNPANGSWSDSLNWLSGAIAAGSGSSALFNTIDVPTNASPITVTADFSDGVNGYGITNGNMYFGDTVTNDGAASWIVADGGLGITLEGTTSSNSIIDVNLAKGANNNLIVGWGTATIRAGLSGTNTLVKSGPNRLILNPTSANTYTGGTVISNGILELGAGQNGVALNTGPVIFYGGALRLSRAAIPGSSPNSSTSDTGYPYSAIVPDGQTGTLYMTPYATGTRTFGSGTVSGGGTLNLVVDYVRDNLAGDWSGFTGRVNVASSTRGNSDLRFDSTFVVSSWSNNAVSFSTNGVNANIVTMYNPGAPIGSVIEIGEMSASIPGVVNVISGSTTLNNGGGNSAPFILQVGALNTDASFSGNFTAGNGSVGIVKVGTGNWTLNGPTVEYTGKTVIESGTLQIGSGSSGKLGRSAVVTNNATLAFGRSDTGLIVTNVIDGPGILLQLGGGRTTLAPSTGANTYTGKTMVTNGTLAFSGQAALGAIPGGFVADQVTLNGGSIAATTTLALDSGTRGITIGASGGGLGADGAGTLTVANVIGGSGSLTVNNTGTVELSGANNLTGRTILQSGKLLLNSEVPLGVAPGLPTADQITFDGGTLRSASTFSIDDANRGVTVNAAGGTISPDASTTLTIAEPIVGTGTLSKSGAGTLILNGVVSATVSTVIGQGTLAIGPGGAIGSGSLTVPAGSTLDATAAGGLVLAAGQTLTGNGLVVGNVTAPSGSTISPGSSIGIISISGNLTLSGGTNLVEISSVTNDVIMVSGDVALSGVSTIDLQLLSALPVGTYPLIKYGGALTSGTPGANLVIKGYPLSRVTATLANNTITKSIDLVISGSPGNLVWTGGLNGNAWDVNTTPNWLNGVTPDVFLSSDSVVFNSTGSANPTVSLVGDLLPGNVSVDTAANDYTFVGSGKLTGLASLSKSSAGTLQVLTTNDYIGTTTITAGTVQVGNGTISGSLGTGSIVDNGTLIFNLPDSRTVEGGVSGGGSLTVQAGKVILASNNSYGSSTVNPGATLQVGNGGTAGSLGTGGVTDNGSIVFDRTGVVTNSGSIGGSGSLLVQGVGTVVLAADNSYAGLTTVDAGILQVGAGGTAGTLGTAGVAVLTNSGTLAFSRSDRITNSVTVSGDGTLAQSGSGTLVITNDANSYTKTLVTSGKLQLGDGVNASGKLGSGEITVTAPGSFVLNRPDVYTSSNRIVGSGSVALVGGTNVNVMVSSGANTYSGGTTVSNSAVVLVAAVTSPAAVGVQNVNQTGLGTGSATFLGNSSLQLAWADQTDPDLSGSGNFATAINVPAGQKLTVNVPGRFEFSSAVSGAGTIDYGANYVRGNVTGPWTNFTGTLNIISNAVNTNLVAHDFRLFNTAGFPNAKVHIDSASLFNRGTSGASIPIGELSGTETAFFGGTGGSEGGNAVSWVIGGLNTDSTYDGTSSSSVAVGVTKVGSGRLTFTGANGYTGNTVVSNGVLALSTNSVGADATLSSSATLIVAAPGILDVTSHTDNTLQNVTTLAGNGTVRGNVYNIGTIAPGFSSNIFGNLTITSNLISDGSINLKIDHIGTAVSDKITAPSIVINSAINVTQPGTNNLVTGDTFVLFSGPVSGFGTNAVSLPTANADFTINYVWTNRVAIDGTVQLLQGASSTVNLNPTNITFSVSGGSLNLSWPADHLGWTLETNAVSLTDTNSWFLYPGSSSVTNVSLSIDSTKKNVFFRLIAP